MMFANKKNGKKKIANDDQGDIILPKNSTFHQISYLIVVILFSSLFIVINVMLSVKAKLFTAH